MAAELYYGNGNCSIEGSNIRIVHIRFRGAISIIDKSPERFYITHKNNNLMIFPIDSSAMLNNLFDYTGEFKILYVGVADSNAERVVCTIKRVMDYAELLETNAEDMTTKSEDLKAGYIYGNKVAKTTIDKQIVENLNTSTRKGVLYLKTNIEYHGAYHIHLKDNSIMTGRVHNANSQSLYFKQAKDGVLIDKLVSTKNPTSIPLGLKLQKRKR